MKIKGTHTRSEIVEVSISPSDAFEAVWRAWLKGRKLPRPGSHYDYLRISKEGNWENEYEESAGSHSYFKTDTLRPATPEEKAAFAAFNTIREAIKEL